ncbi:MAG: PRC-barrel domain-containing protein [Chloroflexota bacterium]|nr:PRC-barrel domain-containing protein [Chloroflexota bacterium]
MPASPRNLRLEDLIQSKVVTSEGKKLGSVVDVLVTRGPEYRVEALVLGLGGWLDRLHILRPLASHLRGNDQPRRVPWDAVQDFRHFTLTLKPGREEGLDRPSTAAHDR